MRVRLSSSIGLFCLALCFLGGSSVTASVTPVQTQTIASSYAVWGPNTTFQGPPLVFDKFDPALGELQSINLTVSYSFTNKVSMTFNNPSAPQTIALTTALPQSPTVGPTITLNGPSNGPLSNLLTVSAPVVSYTKTYGGPGQGVQTFSNNPAQFATNSPFYLTPDGMPGNTTSTFTGTRTLTLSNPAQLALFLGSGNFTLPASASFGATSHETGGNDYGSLTTYAGISVSLSYTYVVPEPPSAALLGLGTGGLLVLGKLRRRRAAV